MRSALRWPWGQATGSRARPRLGLLSEQQLVRAIWLGVLIGVVAGGGAIMFAWSIEFATDHLLVALAGYQPAQPFGEGAALASGPDRPWALPLLLGLGGLASGLLVFWLAPEAEGHGTDAAIEAFHQNSGRVRLRVVPVKLVASAITIGSGGAAGREGPTAQIGSGFGSFIADRLHLGPVERRKALAAGIGAGIGSIFRAPLGGAMMAAEVLYKHDLEADVILLGLISAIVGYSVYGTWSGWQPIFGGSAGFSFSHPGELPYYAGLGVVCGLVGILYARGFYGITALFRRLPLPRVVKPAVGGVLVGMVGVAVPEAIHVGYGTVQQMLTRDGIQQFSPWLLLALPLLRIATTSMSIGSGGSGGIFGPGMVIGGAVGAAAWRLGHGLPGFPAEPGPVVIICMIAAFGSIAHAPLAMLLMVGEMTGNLSLLAPAMVAVAIATLVVGEATIYESQVATRADSPAHRHRFSIPLLSTIPVDRACIGVQLLDARTPTFEAAERMRASRAEYAVLIGGTGRLLATVERKPVERAAEHDPTSKVERWGETMATGLLADASLEEALDRLAESGRSWLPVVDRRMHVIGAVDLRGVLRAYRQATRVGIRPVLAAFSDTETFELPVTRGSPVVGKRLEESGFPPGARVLSVARGESLLVPYGGLAIQWGDILTVACSRGTRPEALRLVLGKAEEE